MRYRQHMRVFGFLFLLSILPPSSIEARVWRVVPDQSGDAPTVQAAIDSAQAGDEVLLAAGTYTWTSEGASGHSMIQMKAEITLRGEAGPESTILDAEGQGRVLLCRNVGNAQIRGVTVQNGISVGGEGIGGNGPGIYSLGNSQPTISNCIVRGNTAGDYAGGAGICIDGGATIEDCQILENSAGLNSGGAGIATFCLDDCPGVLIQRCTIRNNTVEGHGSETGGGIYAYGTVTISDCWIEGNRVRNSWGAAGGGVSIVSQGRTASIIGCTFVGNIAEPVLGNIGSGGGVYVFGECTISNSIFVANQALTASSLGKASEQ